MFHKPNAGMIGSMFMGTGWGIATGMSIIAFQHVSLVYWLSIFGFAGAGVFLFYLIWNFFLRKYE